MKLNGIPPIKSVMTAFPYYVETGDSVRHARRLMDEHDIRHLPVVEGGKLISVVTRGRLRRAKDNGRLAEVCERKVYVVPLSEPLDRVLMHMAAQHIDCALVAKEGRLVGIFTVSDGCRTFGEVLRSLFPKGGDDAA